MNQNIYQLYLCAVCDSHRLHFLCRQEILIPRLGINYQFHGSKETVNYHTFSNPLSVDYLNIGTNINLLLEFYSVRILYS